MIRNQGCTFKHSGVELDGQEFIDCIFDHCRIVYPGGPLPRFSGKTVFDTCEFKFEGAAGDTIEMLKLLARQGNTELVEGIFRSIIGPTN